MRKAYGFTVVELLIIIVVIGILAAIMIVGYNFMGDRAREASIQSDLLNATKAAEEYAIRNKTNPTTLPDSVQPSQGNVLHLVKTDDDFCVNGYTEDGRLFSMSSSGDFRTHSCNGVLEGSPVGGSLPAVPGGVNLAGDFSQWTLSGGVTYDSSTGLLCLNSSSGTATSPLVRVDGSKSATLSVQNRATQSSPNQGSNSAGYYGSRYYGEDGSTQVKNTSGYTANGNAQTLPLNTWRTHTWSPATGSLVKYVRFTINSSPTTYTSDNCLKDPEISATM